MFLEIYTRRWGHRDRYEITKTTTGWKIQRVMSVNGECDKTGAPYLFKALDHDSVNYPESLGGYMEWLWEQSTERNWDDTQIQEQLSLLSDWIETVEKESPKGIWYEPAKYK